MFIYILQKFVKYMLISWIRNFVRNVKTVEERMCVLKNNGYNHF